MMVGSTKFPGRSITFVKYYRKKVIDNEAVISSLIRIPLQLTLPPHTTVPPSHFACSMAERNISTACLVCRGPHNVSAEKRQTWFKILRKVSEDLPYKDPQGIGDMSYGNP